MSPAPVSLHGAAAALADAGYAVFPVAGKIPRTPHGCHDATRDVNVLDSWWSAWPDAGLGIATGEVSGTWVLDVDGDAGAATLRALTTRHHPLPATVTVRTRRGWHLYWQLGGLDVRNSAGRVGPGLDVRGRGGYVIAPPSAHPDGGRYTWLRDPYDHDLVAAPAWLLALAMPAPEPRHSRELSTPLPTAPGDRSRYVAAAIEAECADLARAPEGQRNDALNRAAYSLGRFIEANEVDTGTVARALAHAAAVAGLQPREIEKTLRSALGARGVA